VRHCEPASVLPPETIAHHAAERRETTVNAGFRLRLYRVRGHIRERRTGTTSSPKRLSLSGVQVMENVRTRELYRSPNGDCWYLCRNTSGKIFVLHQANIPAGGRVSQIELGDFLARAYGPEQQALLQMIGSLIEQTPAETAEDANPGELLTGEGDPGLSLTGGSGHA
jgi:hypothetical protein